MTSKGLGEMFEGDSADMCAGKFPQVSMGGRAEGQACTDPRETTPIGASGIFFIILQQAKTRNLPAFAKFIQFDPTWHDISCY